MSSYLKVILISKKDRRKRIYKEFEAKNHNLNLEDLELLDKDGDVGKIISFYDAWATVVKRHYLPIKYFKGINGVTAVRLYYIIEPYIDYRRSRDTTIKHDDKNIVLSNDSYAKNYEWLIKKIIDKNYVKTIEQNEQS